MRMILGDPLLDPGPANVRRWAVARACSPLVVLAGMIALLGLSPALTVGWVFLGGLAAWAINEYSDRVACPHCGKPYFIRPERAFGVELTRHLWLARTCANCGQAPAPPAA